jgi:hypothetical protein
MRKVYLRELGVGGYRNMSAADSISQLQRLGYQRLLIPKIPKM